MTADATRVGDRGQPGSDPRLYQLLEAIPAVAGGLSLPEVLGHIVESACALAGARYGALGVIGENQTLIDFITVGAEPDVSEAIGHYPEGHGILGLLIVDPRPLRLADLTAHPDSYGFPEHHPPMRSFLGVPVRVRDEVYGNLYLCEKRDADEFSADDEALIVSLAAMAAVAIDNARLHERLQDLAVLRDRERIARDLHDKVIQRLFATGLFLQAASHGLDASAAGKLGQAVDELDTTISEIRNAIFGLEARPADRPNLSAALLALVDEITQRADLEPTVSINGPLNAHVDPALGDDLLTAVGEAVVNVARHAEASHVSVTVHVDSQAVVLRVLDDGHGPRGGRPGGHGLANLEARATRRGGSCRLSATDEGACLEWRVPLPD